MPQQQSPTHHLDASAPHRDRFDAVVELNHPLCREHFLLRVRVVGPHPFPHTEPGQFIQLGCCVPDAQADMDALRGGEVEWAPGRLPRVRQPELRERVALLRRPFSLAGRGDDDRGAWLEVVHRVVGVGTDWLSRLKAGDAVDLIGPLGNTFTLPANKRLGLLVGGGVGLPPMFYLAQAMRKAGWEAVAFVGAMAADLLAVTPAGGTGASSTPLALLAEREGRPTRCIEQFARHGFPAVVTTNDGSVGLPGLITDGLRRFLESLSHADAARCLVYTCGPDRMMHAVADLAEPRGIPCQVCLEQAMACGMGTCQSCVVKIDPLRWRPGASETEHGRTREGRPWRFKLACTDGPVFDSRCVVW